MRLDTINYDFYVYLNKYENNENKIFTKENKIKEIFSSSEFNNLLEKVTIYLYNINNLIKIGHSNYINNDIKNILFDIFYHNFDNIHNIYFIKDVIKILTNYFKLDIIRNFYIQKNKTNNIINSLSLFNLLNNENIDISNYFIELTKINSKIDSKIDYIKNITNSEIKKIFL